MKTNSTLTSGASRFLPIIKIQILFQSNNMEFQIHPIISLLLKFITYLSQILTCFVIRSSYTKPVLKGNRPNLEMVCKVFCRLRQCTSLESFAPHVVFQDCLYKSFVFLLCCCLILAFRLREHGSRSDHLTLYTHLPNDSII